jgi:large subunit ribosomal protein L30
MTTVTKEKKATVKKAVAVAEKKVVKKMAKKSASESGKKTITVKLIRSTIACNPKQRATAIGLGLTKMNKVSVLEDTRCVRGMINKIIHMVEVTL